MPVPEAEDLDALNAQLLAGCRADEARLIDGRTHTVGEALTLERPHLRALAPERFDLEEVSFPRVDGLGRVPVKTNLYSVPAPVGTQVQARLGPDHVDMWADGHRLARHERCYGRHQERLLLEHYLDVLERKPGAFAGSTALAQARARGMWPVMYDELWTRLMARHGKQEGTRHMVGVLQLGRHEAAGRLTEVVAQALTLGCADLAAIRHLSMAADLSHPVVTSVAVGPLACYDRPLPVLDAYDGLLAAAEAL